MTDWTARIDALPKLPPDLKDEPCGDFIAYLLAIRAHYKAATALAAERLRESHTDACDIDFFDVVYHEEAGGEPVRGKCTCGLVADVLKILEGK